MADQQKKTVIVTGGTRGIGFAIVRTLLEKGYDVTFTGRTKESIQTALDKLKELGLLEVAHASEFNILDTANLTSIDEFVLRAAKPLYGLVNCAGVNVRSRIGELGWWDAWHRVVGTNLDGPALLTNALSGNFSNPGRIVNIASQLADVGRSGYSAYCASKAGLVGLTKALSCELAQKGITVNAVSPGWIETEMIDDEFKEIAAATGKTPSQARSDIEDRLDQRRFNMPEEVANIVAFLLSPEASGITGRCIPMAGPSA